MDFDKTQQLVAEKLNLKSPEHKLRAVFASVITASGVFMLVVLVLRNEPVGFIVPLMVFGGASILFTKQVIAGAKALLPWKSRNGS